MNMILINPTTVLLPSDGEDVKQFLQYEDRGVSFLIKKTQNNFRWKKSDPEGFFDRINELKEQRKKSLLFYDDGGRPCTYSGLWKDLHQRFKWGLTVNFDIPEAKNNIPWSHTPHTMRYYQKEAVDALIMAREGSVSLPTGSGKSLVLMNLAKQMSLQTMIFVPFSSIAKQLYRDFVHHFGKKYVGMYGDTKRDIGKLITIGVTQSLMKLEPGSEAFDFFNKTQVLMGDECHTVPAAEFQKVTFNLCNKATYRFFLSATVTRTDGSEMLLKGLAGNTVYSKGFKELVDQGYLARPFFKIFKVPVCNTTTSDDPKTETRNQLYNNPNVNKFAAQIATKIATSTDRQIVILIEEFKQFEMLRNYLGIEYHFAHGGASEAAKKFLPKEYWKSDTDDLVAKFNAGKIKCLIGTNVISTGVDLKPTGCVIYLQGGTSTIKVSQGIGRGTRVTETKRDVWVVDFKVVGSRIMERHADTRMVLYDSLGEIKEI